MTVIFAHKFLILIALLGNLFYSKFFYSQSLHLARILDRCCETNLWSMILLRFFSNDSGRTWMNAIFFCICLGHIKYARSIMKLHYSGKVEQVNGLKARNVCTARGYRLALYTKFTSASMRLLDQMPTRSSVTCLRCSYNKKCLRFAMFLRNNAIYRDCQFLNISTTYC